MNSNPTHKAIVTILATIILCMGVLSVSYTAAAQEIECGNVNGLSGPGGPIDVSDLTFLVAFLFTGGPPPPSMWAANVNGDIGPGGPVDVGDLTYLVAALFTGGPWPVCSSSNASIELQTIFEGGTDWNATWSVRAVAMGDVTCDGKDEIGIMRYGTGGGQPVYWVMQLQDDGSWTKINPAPMDGSGWGYPSVDIAFGDVDGDGCDELIVARDANENGQLYISKYLGDNTWQLLNSGSGLEWWGYAPTHIATGDVDGDGTDEIAVTRNAPNNKLNVYSYSNGSITDLDQTPDLVFSGYPTDVAMGDWTVMAVTMSLLPLIQIWAMPRIEHGSTI